MIDQLIQDIKRQLKFQKPNLEMKIFLTEEGKENSKIRG